MKKRQYARKPAPDTSVMSAGNLLQTRPFQADNSNQQAPQVQKESEALTGGFDLTKQYLFNPPTTVSDQPLQAKLTIGEPNDKYEQEADRVAHDVVQQINSAQTAEASPQTLAQRQDETVQMKPPLQKKKVLEGGEASSDLESSINQARGSGQPLDANLQRQMGQAMGADFSGVKVHTDSQADQLNQSIQAKAFTTGQDIFFRQGAYQPRNCSGQELIAHELTHVVQQNMGNGTQIQRKIGFEFEYDNWRTAEASSTHFATVTNTQPNGVDPNSPQWKKIKKGKALVRGNGFELQADDDPNNAAKSDLEVVTDPFDEGIKGRGQIRSAMQGIQNTLGHITANLNGWWAAGHLPRAIDIPGNTVRDRAFLYPNTPGFRAKPQVTVGLSLDKVANLLEDVFAAPVETVPEATNRRQGRMELTGWDPNANAAGSILQTQGQAPSQARQAIATYLGNNPLAPAQSQDLVGLLSLMIAYLRMADQNLVRSYAKTIAPVMARTDFGALFKMLSPQEQNWYKANSGQAFFDLVQSAPWLATMATGDEVFSQGVANPTLGVGQAQGLTRGKWIKGIAKGTDYLTGKKFPDKAQRGDIEGLGAYGKKKDTIALPGGVTKDAAILELRSMPKIDLANIDAVADRIWLYTYLVNRGGNEKYGEVQQGF